MDVTKAVPEQDRPLTLAETEAYAQFDASDRAGLVVFHPQVASDEPAPDAAFFATNFTRLLITYLPGRYRVEGKNWFGVDDDGGEVSITNPLARCWDAAMAAKSRIELERNIGAWVVPVAAFVDMEPDDGIREAEAKCGARVLFGLHDHVESLLSLLKQRDLQYPLNGLYIDDEAAALTRRSVGSDPETRTESKDLGDVSRYLGMPKVDIKIDTVYIYVTVYVTVNSSGDGDDGVEVKADPQP